MRLIFRSVEAKYRLMLKAILGTLRFFILILAGHQDIALENATLRQQLTILKRQRPRPKLRHRDRLFWIALMKIWKQWRTALVVVQPATVVSWQRRRFKQYWRKLSQKKGPGRPKVSAEVRKLVRTMAAANVTWARHEFTVNFSNSPLKCPSVRSLV
jgi:hypothetical protein